MRYFLILFLFICYNFSSGQSRDIELIRVLDSVISKSKEISYYRNTVNWDSLSFKMHDAAKGSKNISELKPAFEILLNGLRDHHGHFRELSQYSVIASFTDHKNSRSKDNRVYDPEIWKIVNDANARYEYALLPNGIAYLKIVGVGPNLDGQKEAERIRNSITEFKEKDVTKWIIDLRYNGGGNINVMFAGIAPLLDTETVVTIQDYNNDVIARQK